MSQSDDKHTGITLWCKFACIADIKIWPIEPTYDQFCKKSVTAEVLLCNIIKTGKKICFPISIYHNDGTEMSQIHSFIHSFHWHAQNSMIPCHSQELLPFLCYVLFPATLPHQLFFHPLSPHLAMPHFCQAAAFSRWTNMMKLMVTFCNFANMAKNYLPFTFN